MKERCGVLFLVFLLLLALVAAQEIYINPGSRRALNNTDFVILVDLDGPVDELFGYQFDLFFNDSGLDFSSMEAGPFLLCQK
jgi:hypothetical protein